MNIVTIFAYEVGENKDPVIRQFVYYYLLNKHMRKGSPALRGNK